ncbi:MAG: alpha/beta fold hydrolase [Miltoncostaeaceae bacterium]
MPAEVSEPRPFRVAADGATLAGEEIGDGPPVLLLHGLTATRRYVVHGALTIPRAGYRLISYDARGHGESGRGADYSYAALLDDALAVLDDRDVERAAVVGQSMGAATAAALAIGHGERVAALGLVTPAHRGTHARKIDYWDGLADGLDRDGIDGFLTALEPMSVPEKWRGPVRTVIRQRMERHADLGAVSAALRGVQRTTAFDSLDDLARIGAPTLVVGSRDEVDADHPLAIAEDYAALIPEADLVVEAEGESPLAWRGGALSKALLERFAEAGWAPENGD